MGPTRSPDRPGLVSLVGSGRSGGPILGIGERPRVGALFESRKTLAQRRAEMQGSPRRTVEDRRQENHALSQEQRLGGVGGGPLAIQLDPRSGEAITEGAGIFLGIFKGQLERLGQDLRRFARGCDDLSQRGPIRVEPNQGSHDLVETFDGPRVFEGRLDPEDEVVGVRKEHHLSGQGAAHMKEDRM